MDDNLKGYHLLLGVTGGIAACKAALLCSRLVQAQAELSVVMTAHAQRFVTPLTFTALARRRVYTDLFHAQQDYQPEHISLAEKTDLILIAPATANIIAKFAQGICDDLLSSLFCAAQPQDVLLAPAMNERMWNHPATQRNTQTLRDWGVQLVGPATGMLACGTQGTGRMSEPDDIFRTAADRLQAKPPKRPQT